jgi:16S rRNA (cytosine1402-N4)-methyltransferase
MHSILAHHSPATLPQRVAGLWARAWQSILMQATKKKSPPLAIPFLAGRREEQGTALLPPLFSGLCPQIIGAYSANQLHFTAERISALVNYSTSLPDSFLMAGRVEEQGTAPLPPTSSHYHHAVLADEVDEWMDAQPSDVILDGTLGGGGHTEIFLKKNATVLAIDRDPQAIAFATQRLSAFRETLHTFQANYSQMAEHPQLPADGKVDKILLDIGVSSHQIDCAERGFSFQKDGPLDMRMGPNACMSAADFINESSEREILQVLREFGEEPQARRITQLIVERRKKSPFTRTGDLAGTIEQALGRFGKTHPATRTFQAIRMRVNEELTLLQSALEASVALLRPGGRLLVITFHSLEDRLTKQFIQHRAKPFIDDPTWPAPRENPEYFLTLPMRKAISAGSKELSANPRARSAKLRVALRNDRNLPTLYLS